MIMCDRCRIFKAWVTIDRNLCYPCYFWHHLGNKDQAIYWLDFRKVSGEDREVRQWYEANRQDNSLQEQV
jgi:hypothetical protein